MDAKKELTGLFHAMVMNELRFMRGLGPDVGYQSLIYLDLVRYTDGCTVGSLAAALGLDKSTVSRKVDALAEEGLLAKERDPDDGRVVRLRLGDRIAALYDIADTPYYRAGERMASELSGDELASVMKAVGILEEELGRGTDGL